MAWALLISLLDRHFTQYASIDSLRSCNGEAYPAIWAGVCQQWLMILPVRVIAGRRSSKSLPIDQPVYSTGNVLDGREIIGEFSSNQREVADKTTIIAPAASNPAS